ncbi:hypothetical protein BDW69DRAFT_189482 [Aspergillus filifer]
MRSHCCPGAAFHALDPVSDTSKIPEHYQKAPGCPSSTPNESPFNTLSQIPTGETLTPNIEAARGLIAAVQRFDAEPNVFVVAAHDKSIREIFPNSSNDWMDKGLNKKRRWVFLQDLEPALDLV